MNPFTGIIDLLAGGLKLAANWLEKYGSDKNTEARRIEDEIHRNDEFRKAVREKDLEAIRRILGARP